MRPLHIITLLLLPYISYFLHAHLTSPSLILQNTINKTVIITGASQGIGSALVSEYARLQASNIVILSRTESKLQTVKEENEALYPNTKIHVIVADLSNEDKCEDAVNRVMMLLDDLKLTVDIVVLNHITDSSYGSFFEYDDAGAITKSKTWKVNEMMDVNLKSYIFLTSSFMPHLLKSPSGGRLSVISSLASMIGNSNTALYCASKAGVRNFFDALRIELTYGYNAKFKPANGGISVTTSHIGATDTEGTVDLRKNMNTLVQWGPSSDAAKAIAGGAALRKREIFHPFDVVFGGLWFSRFFPGAFDWVLWNTLK